MPDFKDRIVVVKGNSKNTTNQNVQRYIEQNAHKTTLKTGNQRSSFNLESEIRKAARSSLRGSEKA